MVILIKRQTLEDLILLLIINAHGIALYLLYLMHKEATKQQIIVGNFIEYESLSNSIFPNNFYLKTNVFDNEISMKFDKIQNKITNNFVLNDINSYFSINQYQTFVNKFTKSVITLFFDGNIDNFKVLGTINIPDKDYYFNILPSYASQNHNWKNMSLNSNPHLFILQNKNETPRLKDLINILIGNKDYLFDGKLYKKHEDSIDETKKFNRYLNIYLSDIIALVELNFGHINASMVSIKLNSHDKNKEYFFKNQIYSIDNFEK